MSGGLVERYGLRTCGTFQFHTPEQLLGIAKDEGAPNALRAAAALELERRGWRRERAA